MRQMRRLFSIFMILQMHLTLLNANEHFLLPDQKSDLIYSLKSKIKRAEHITLFTSHLHSPQMDKAIEKAISRGATLRLITTDMQSAAVYAKYRDTEVFVPSATERPGSFSIHLLLIDESDLCVASLPFDEEILRRENGIVTCSTDKEEIAFAQRLRALYTTRFEPYNP